MNLFSITEIFFTINGLLCLACAFKMRGVYKKGGAILHKYFSYFFFSMAVFFFVNSVPAIISGFSLDVVKQSFSISQLFLFLSLAFFMMVPTGIWLPTLKKPIFVVVVIAGVLSVSLTPFYYKLSPIIVDNFISWQLPLFLGLYGFLVSAIIAGASALFFLRGGMIAIEAKSKKRSYVFALASFLLLFSAFFWAGETSPWLPLSYIAGILGYLLAYVGVYMI
ncbi:MAG: hypothetical protein COU81_00465 [Candidatus Portnoybacteria bacterium CG10_big_fil_rev_8_21_14_0_10_36_7]|uniref:Uncharacterized protein n=1 Tax=Candidatus Portnoybacteria bacterium CG10_big_fil_rev_8_21_14_0_10_36_7 TaxID=1974812 RepID=A0A2M8KEZ2_9BACT|nr:MAG: hypothetical protein COU81_00465 [Candidatus Portnoybacteria bacterium CG10_big_fil_rev_8_21_14_0_10_36_7]